LSVRSGALSERLGLLKTPERRILLSSARIPIWFWRCVVFGLVCYIPPVLQGAESGICAFGGAGTLAGALTLGRDVLEPDNRLPLARPAANAAVLALLVAAACPEATERALDQNQSNARLWLGSLKGDLESSLPPDLIPPTLSSLTSDIHCTSSTPGLCSLRERLRELLGSGSPRMAKYSACVSIGLILTESVVKDFMAADGAYVIDSTHDLATVLSVCPDQFYVFMHSHPKELDAWLQQADRFLFWGDPSYKAALEQYRSELISQVERSLHRDGFSSEKKKILAHFLRTGVRLTQ
jgi:hypothetical protein